MSDSSDASHIPKKGATRTARLVLLGCAFYVGTVVAAAHTTPSYSHTQQLVSELGELGSPAESWMSVMLVAVGTLVASFSLALGKVREMATKSGRLWLGALAGGLVLGGIFPCDPTCAPRTFSGWAHILSSMPATLGTVLAPYSFSAHMRRWGWEQPAATSTRFGLATLVALIAAVLVFPQLDCRGLGQRLATLLPLAWVGWLALLILHPPVPARFPGGPNARGLLWQLARRQGLLATLQALTEKHGRIVGVRFLGQRLCVITDPKLTEELFVRNAHALRQWAPNLFEPVLGQGLLTSSGDLWRRQRRLLQPHFSKKHLPCYRSAIERLALEQLDGWSDGDTIEVHKAGLQVSTRVANSILFGDDARGLEDVVEQAHKALMEHFEATLRMPVPLWLPTRRNIGVRRAIRGLDDAISELVRKRRNEASFGHDFLGTLLRSQLTHEDLDDKLVRDECVTILLAATETTAVALSWTLYLMALHPRSTEELAQAIDREFANRGALRSNLSQRLPQLTNAILESMRLYTPVWATGRTAVGDCFIGDYVLPAGTRVFTVPYLANRDPRNFAAPLEFLPERWSQGQDCPHSDPGATRCHPFGVGPHKCIGADLALEELSILLALIIQRFRLEIAKQNAPPEEQASVTLRPRRGIQLKLRARVPVRRGGETQIERASDTATATRSN